MVFSHRLMAAAFVWTRSVIFPLLFKANCSVSCKKGEIKPLGSTKTLKIDVRVIALTNLDLEKMIADRMFREDLFYRLNVVSLTTPSLKELSEDIPILVAHFIKKVCRELDIPLKRFDQWAITALMRRSWPGNVRELQNVVRRAVMFCPNDIITVTDPQFYREPPASCLSSRCRRIILKETENSRHIRTQKNVYWRAFRKTTFPPYSGKRGEMCLRGRNCQGYHGSPCKRS